MIKKLALAIVVMVIGTLKRWLGSCLLMFRLLVFFPNYSRFLYTVGFNCFSHAKSQRTIRDFGHKDIPITLLKNKFGKSSPFRLLRLGVSYLPHAKTLRTRR
jgi:hypothetical protein